MNDKVKFERYAQMLREWSSRMNLVAPSTLNDIETRHIADSAQLADVLPCDVNIIDLGSGAGFPGVVLAILGWRVTCIESIVKLSNFNSSLTAFKNETFLPMDSIQVTRHPKSPKQPLENPHLTPNQLHQHHAVTHLPTVPNRQYDGFQYPIAYWAQQDSSVPTIGAINLHTDQI